MTKTELMPLLESLGLHPSRRLGQNFLVDPNLLASLVRDAAPQAGETILEIGPGPGILTRPLLATGVKLTSIELDHRFAAYLRDALANMTSFRLIEGDACDIDFDALMGSGPYRCIANLPYAVSTTVLTRLAAAVNPPTECFVLLQKEMADRLAAKPGTKAYGGANRATSASLCGADPAPGLAGGVFSAAGSGVGVRAVHTRRPNAPSLELRNRCRDLARLGFGHRRKQFAKLLATRFPRRCRSRRHQGRRRHARHPRRSALPPPSSSAWPRRCLAPPDPLPVYFQRYRLFRLASYHRASTWG